MNEEGKLVEWYEEGKAKHWWKFNSSCASDLDVSENLMRWWHQYNIVALDQASATYGKHGTWNDFQWHAEWLEIQ